MNRLDQINNKIIEGEYESPRLRGYLFVGIVVFSAFLYTGCALLLEGESHDSCMIRRSNSFRPCLAGIGMSGNGPQHNNRYFPKPLARLVRCGLSFMMRRGQELREAVHANTAELTVDRDRRRFKHEGIVCLTVLDLSRAVSIILVVASLAACGEPMYENAGSQHSLLEDREACAMEMEQSPAAIAYRQNPTAHPDYVSQVFTDMNRCIERKGWKQARSQQEQERVSDAITSEMAQTGPPVPLSDSKAREALARAVEDRLARSSSSVQSAKRKD